MASPRDLRDPLSPECRQAHLDTHLGAGPEAEMLKHRIAFITVHLIPPIYGSRIITESNYQGVRETGRVTFKFCHFPVGRSGSVKEGKEVSVGGCGGDSPAIL